MSSKAKKSPNVQSLHMQEKMALVNRMEELLTILDSLQNPNINLNKLDKKLFQSSFPKHIEMLQEQTRLMSQLSLDAKPHSTSGTSRNTEFSLSTTEPTTQAFRKHHLSDEATQKEKESGNKLIGPPAQHKETDALSTSSSLQPQSVPTSLISALPAPILVPVLVPCTPVRTFLTPPFPSHSQPIPIISGPQTPLVFSRIQTPESSLYQEELRNKLLVIIKEMSSSEPALKGFELDLTKMLLDRWEYWKLMDLFQTPTILKKEIALAFETLQKQQKKKAMEIDEQVLGEKLYRAIQEMPSPPSGATEKICKITGMLLEMEQSEVNNLLENPHDLKEKIEEALAVLEVHQELLKDPKKFVSPDPSLEPLNRDNLASASPQEQKQELGEKLFEAVEGMISLQNGCSAGKITGMLLELENSELLHLLNSPKDLKEKVEEAESVLRAHKLLSEDKSSTSAAVGEKRPHGTNLKEEKLNALPPEEQKQMIGEELYTTILKMSISPFVAENIGKIIGMLLEIRNSELLKLLKSQQDLRNKVVEAVAVLEAHENGSKNRKVTTGDGCANSSSAAVGEMRPHGTNLKEGKFNALPPEEQKQMIGEELYTAILKMSISPFVAENIGKIIGMLLEIKNSELLKLLKSQTDLKNKVLEAVAVLEAHENGSKDRELSAGDRCAKLYPNQPTDGDNDGRHLSTSSSSSLCDDQENKRDPELDEFFDLLKL